MIADVRLGPVGFIIKHHVPGDREVLPYMYGFPLPPTIPSSSISSIIIRSINIEANAFRWALLSFRCKWQIFN